MTRLDLVGALRALTDKQFVELFYEATQGRHFYERNVFDAHLVLANAVRDRQQGGAWTIELVCPSQEPGLMDDTPMCQAGSHCGMATTSWGKRSQCPVCGDEVYGT